MAMEWVVAAVFILVGLVAAVGLYLGERDPSTRAYKPSIRGLFMLGRTSLRPKHSEGPDKDAKDGGPRATKS